MNRIQKLTGIVIILAVTSVTAQAENADVNVSGKITPGGCHLSFDGNNTVDVGNISAHHLKPDAVTKISNQYLGFTVQCDGPTRFALTFSSGRGASAINDDGTLSDVGIIDNGQGATVELFGLGLQGSKGIGGYSIAGNYAYHNQTDYFAGIIKSDGNTTSWEQYQPSLSLIAPGAVPRYFSWAPVTETGFNPGLLTHLRSGISIAVYMNKSTELDMSQPIHLDGLAALEMVYL